jgi:multiple sugar transport system permease protein
VGLVQEFIPWLGDQRYAMITIILISAWAWFPFVAITLLAALQTIPTAYYEAAALDGAGPIRRFWALTLPLLAPAIIVVVLLRSIWALRNFDMIFLLTGGGPVTATYILPILTYTEAFGKFRLGYATAVATLLMLFLTMLALLYFRAYTSARKITHS